MNRHVALGVIALVVAVAGGAFIGGAAWINQGEARGTGDLFGLGILVPLGAIFILFGLGAGLAAAVTYAISRD